MMEAIITVLYAGVGIFNAFLYTPQIVRAWKSHEYALGQSVMSWCGWTITSIIAFLFGAFVVESWPMMAVATVDFFGHALVAIPALRARIK